MNYILHNECMPVAGKKRGIIYDLGRSGYDFIPLNLTQFLASNDTFTVKDLNQLPNPDFEPYLSFLLEKEYIFPVETEEVAHFSPNETSWEKPHHITNSFIELGKENLPIINAISQTLTNCLCRHILISVIDLDTDELVKALSELNKTDLRSCSLVMDARTINQAFIGTLFEIQIVTDITLYNHPEPGIDLHQSGYFYKKRIKSGAPFNAKRNANQLRNSFMVNRALFYESVNYNNFYYKKLFIRKDGTISNSLGGTSFGDLFSNDTINNITTIVNSAGFKAPGMIRKDDIQGCQDCEFRYMCMDDRIPQRKKDGTWYHESACPYDPTTCTWK